MKTRYNFPGILVIVIGILCFSCEDFVELDPPNSQVVAEVVFESDELADAAVEGIFHRLYQLTGFASGGIYSVTMLGGLSADEFDLHNTIAYTDLPDFYQNEISIANRANLNVWSSGYNIIYMTNAVLEGLNSSSGVTAETKRQLEGEVRFLRAFTYFYLVNLFGDVPLITQTNYQDNALTIRVSKDKIYELIIEDLEKAKGLLDVEYPTMERTRPNSLAASSLLARVNLYLEKWEEAEKLATEVISAADLYNLSENLSDVFLVNSREAIWQIASAGSSYTFEGNTFILISANSFLNPVILSNLLLDTFEENDARFDQWVGRFDDETDSLYYAYKYKIRFLSGAEPPVEYSIGLRLAEQYLIRAEARGKQGNITGALHDLNTIRNRAGLEDISGITDQELMDAIMKERRIEFFAEWGHRWLDLKRTNRADTVISLAKPGWQSTNTLYPIPEQELERNPNLTQNEGY
ncbi:RagB/SusD family nutrient uptake outer membrane protein [Sinomicrobium pectinilyticum]|uniref:RagB/SusD family nutrient uptake outer membrane protein n=2 Tax=Sinomicrobium pectinilyticum TaxID=1084421 RepID=A0A3N0EL38_SINP1|nr:RagB/SusD family nutrient uptake outer membrane protein [Sinomicrobium pectinilyticum]